MDYAFVYKGNGENKTLMSQVEKNTAGHFTKTLYKMRNLKHCHLTENNRIPSSVQPVHTNCFNKYVYNRLN